MAPNVNLEAQEQKQPQRYCAPSGAVLAHAHALLCQELDITRRARNHKCHGHMGTRAAHIACAYAFLEGKEVRVQRPLRQHPNQMTSLFRKIGLRDLFVSEPNPAWFGNAANVSLPGWSNANWLKSRFHFSFAEWNAGRGGFGCLRVVNDDLVQPARGFGRHGHADMEIMTYVLEGELTHLDSMGTSETLSRGSIQFMTAGTGVQHEEHNRSQDKPLRFIQTWVTPRRRGLKPNYGSYSALNTNIEEQRRNKWLHMVGDQGSESAKIAVNQDCNLFVAEIDEALCVTFSLKEGRQGYLICVEGAAIVDGKELARHEACELVAPAGGATIAVNGVAGPERTHCMLFEMAASK